MPSPGTLKVATPSDREITMSREFDAPRELLWDAWTKPELVQRWLCGPAGWSFAVCDMDLRVGGTYRWVWRKDATGMVMGMSGIYREIVPPERLVTNETFDEAWYAGECLVTITFVERAGRTRVDTTLRYDSQEIRDGVLKSEMARGVGESYDRLETMLPSMAAQGGR